jgi:hypothetical protein
MYYLLASLVDDLLQKVGKFLDYGDWLTAGETHTVQWRSCVVARPTVGML